MGKAKGRTQFYYYYFILEKQKQFYWTQEKNKGEQKLFLTLPRILSWAGACPLTATELQHHG